MGTSHGRLTATNVSVRALILQAFHIKDFQLTGGPAWLADERFDIVAKTEDATISDDQLWQLLQPLLADRFRFRFHRVAAQLPVYALVTAKGGPKLKDHALPADLKDGGKDEATVSGRTSGTKSSLQAVKISTAKLADILGGHLDRTVIDRTGLKGNYDLKLDWAEERQGEPLMQSLLTSLQADLGMSGPTLFTAVQEQLGLKLESAKGQVETIVIDGAERPSTN